MAEFKPTAAQKAAIESRGSTILVSAGAGSGKTKVLTERLMACITSAERPADIDSFLIITFTKAAAGELRGRIMDEIAAALAKDPGNKGLRRQSALCRRAQIGTIHSFCAGILRENCQLAGLSPEFKILDEDRADNMKAQALERVLEKRYEDEEKFPGFSLLADTVGAGRDDSRLGKAVLGLNEKMQSHARPESWAKKQSELLKAGVSDAGMTKWGREILRAAGASTKFWCAELGEILREIVGDEKIRNAYYDSFDCTLRAIEALDRALKEGWDSAKACFPIPFEKLKPLRNSPDPEFTEKIKERRTLCKKTMESLEKSFEADSKKLLGDMALTAPAMNALLELTLDFDREYARDKKRSGLVDYADLEHMAAKLLTLEDGSPTELARQISRRYTEIMVDEYQDVSRVQDAIFSAVSDEGRNLFLVGDVKQSIYRFRLADPEIFTEKYLSFRDAEEAEPGEARRIMLQENFRSRREILRAANCVFSLCMSRELGDIDYDENARLKYGNVYEGEVPVPEIMLLKMQSEDDEGESPDKSSLEARMVGKKIQALMEGGTLVYERGIPRPLEYGDIAVLLRSANSAGPAYSRVFDAMGIPVESSMSGGFFSSMEVSTMLSALAVIDNPHQDIALIAVLSSPAFGFSGDELSDIRAEDRSCMLYEALLKHAENDEKSRSFLERLNRFRRLAPDIPASELLWMLIEDMDMLSICAAMSDGQQRRARLMALMELSEGFESTGYRGLHRFVLWLKKMSETGREPSLGAESSSGVKIMSVHKSKGLEFPVVFLADTARRFNKQDSRETVLVHPDLGLGPKVTDLKRRVEYPTLARNAIKQRLEREMLSEELRLLYVALTRAKERLFVSAVFKDPDKELEKAENAVSVPMAPEILAQVSSPVDWMLFSALADREKHMKINIYNPDGEKAQLQPQGQSVQADEELYGRIKKNLSFCYPYKALEALPSKLTATELKGRAEADGDAQSIAPVRRRAFPMPDFTKEKKPLTGAEKGTATHLMLQYMDFNAAGSEEEIKAELLRLENKKFLSRREAEAVDTGAIRALFASPLGKRMLSADKTEREFKFSLLWDGAELYEGAEGEKLLMQGVVDCFIEEQGELVIIDYKTDYIGSADELERKAEYYSGQMQVYAKSLARICGKRVKECILYFLSVSKAVSVDFSKKI